MNVRFLCAFVLLSHALVFASEAWGQVYEKVFDFTEARAADLTNLGAAPVAGLTLGRDGHFYGTTTQIGELSPGTVFKMTPEGKLTTLVVFSNQGAGLQGSDPQAGLVLGSDGNFYGTTSRGGADDAGTIFRMTPGGQITNLVMFTGGVGPNLGASPHAALVQGSDGDFYGTTREGGANNLGTVFRMTFDGVLTTLVEFTGTTGVSKGSEPIGRLLQASDGNFYGTTVGGGANNAGTIFRMTPAGVLTTMVEFTQDGVVNRGAGPSSGLVQGIDGHFYGTTRLGGSLDGGTVFRTTAGGVLTTLVEFTFDGTSNRGAGPIADLVLGSDGDFYGTTSGGGLISDFGAHGTVFKITPAGVLTTLVEFTFDGASNRGAFPAGALVTGSDGQLYGTTRSGGIVNVFEGESQGTVFKVTPTGALTTLVEFTGSGVSDAGVGPSSELVQAADGHFYGTTAGGGTAQLGTVFRMTPDGTVVTLVNFTNDGASQKGATPTAGLVQASDGAFYGATLEGGASNDGTLFKMTPDGQLTTLVEFTGNGAINKGTSPGATLLEGPGGMFFGTTIKGGANDCGTAFKMTAEGVLTTLVEFTGTSGPNKGQFPRGALVQGNDGNLYGTTFAGGTSNLGTIFKLTPGGVLITLVEFSGTGAASKGHFPEAPLVLGADGHFYGTATGGGPNSLGTVFKLTTDGTPGGSILTALVAFTNNGATNRGFAPKAGLLQRADGFFYGTTSGGGSSGAGTAFKMTPAGVLTTLVEFGSTNGGPTSALIAAADGNLYGTTSDSFGSSGTIYRLVEPGSPMVMLSKLVIENSAGVKVEARANARGAFTEVSLEYGAALDALTNIVPLAVGLSGFQTQLIGTTLTDLLPGTAYFFRFRAVSSAGTTLTPVQSFSTLAEPVAMNLPASEIGPTSARFNGMVNARNFDTSAIFEWGTDGNSFPNTVPAVPGTVTGSTAVSVNAAVAGLPEGGTVFFRIRARNAGGTATSGVRSFSTVSVTTAALGDSDVGVSEAVFRATINTFGQTAAVKFKYWANSAPLVVFETATQTVTSNGATEVSARVTGLLENVSYSYRVSVELAGTETDGSAVGFTTETNVAPVAMPDVIFYTGQVQFDPLANDSDANGDALVLDPVLVVPPTVAAAVASVTVDRLSISYNPQNNVTDEDLLTYRVLDPQGATATAQVRLIAFSKRAGFYGGRADFSGGAVTRSGVVTLQFGTSGAMTTAFFNWAGETYRLKGVFDPSGRLTRTIDLVNFAGSKLTLTLRLDPDAPLIHGSVVERDGSNAIVASVPDFTLTQNAGTGGLSEAGLRTAFLSPPASLAAQMGDGYVVMNVAKSRRSARFAGQLPDGEPFLVSAAAQGRSFSLSKGLESGGMLTGLVRVVGSDADALGMMSDLFWKKRANSRARFHRGNVETTLELLGMDYPALGKGALPPIDLGTGSPNARLRFTGGDLTSALDFPLQIAAGSVSGFDVSQLQLKLRSDLGTFSGRFKHPVTGKFVPFQGAFRAPLDTERGQGRGVFRGPSAVGAVRIEGD